METVFRGGRGYMIRGYGWREKWITNYKNLEVLLDKVTIFDADVLLR